MFCEINPHVIASVRIFNETRTKTYKKKKLSINIKPFYL